MKTPWAQSPESLFQNFEVSPDQGLSGEQVSFQSEKYGPNQLQTKKRTPAWLLLLNQFKSPMVYLLFGAAAVALFLGEKIDAIAILGVVVVNSIIGFFQEFRAGVSIEALAKLSSPKARVLRDGRIVEVEASAIYPGDILVFEAGDFVVADARLFEVNQLSANEAVLTGESLPVEKHIETIEEDASLGDRINMVFASTAIARGSGKAVVTATGTQTEIGKVSDLLKTTQTDVTPLQRRLEGIGHKLLMLVGAVIVLLMGIGILQNRGWNEMIMSALSLAVAVIPEGLPAVVTIALVLGIRRMSHKRALIRKMDAVETLGTTDIICTDKTGTLTTGEMLVRESVLLDDVLEDDHFRVLGLCNNSSIEGNGTGDTTEVALLRFVEEKFIPQSELKQKHKRLKEWSFESDRKRMSVAVGETDSEGLILIKGAPEAIIDICDISPEDKARADKLIDELSHRGMRVLATALKRMPYDEIKRLSQEKAESGAQLLGFIGLADPPREESRAAIEKCQRAGIKIVMITGDHPVTAAAIAREMGIIRGDEKSVTGKELEKMGDQELRELVEKTHVYARVSPEHKLKIVQALQQNGHVVAMTGDGVNDAPALKQASIGVSMGKGGTEVARQASAMVLTDDNFATIVDAVEEGRAVFGNIKRTLQYLLSTNLGLLCFIMVAVAFSWPLPLLPVQLLWINIVTDGLPSIALAAEKVPQNFLSKSDRPSAGTFLDRNFYQEMLIVAIIMTVMGLAIFSYGEKYYELPKARNLAFSFVVYSTLFRSLSCRSERETFLELPWNWFLTLTICAPLLFQFVIQEFPVLAHFFGVAPLEWKESLIVLVLSLTPLALVELIKVWRRRQKEEESL